ncbi:transcription termination factor MTERF2, chloroplastic-like [Chenopodium quinoa]|nr:transcription termination factor MTERF2, chloroplastic-like [Chenopodium quinoa]
MFCHTTTSTTFLHLSTHHNHHHQFSPFITNFSLSSQNPQPSDPPKPPILNPNTQQILRTHNSKSTSFFLLNHHQQQWLPNHEKNDDVLLSEEEKARILELTLVRKRPPQFPGSIYTRPPHGNDLSLPPLNTLLKGDDDGEEGEMLMKAIKIRREVCLEIFIEFMVRKGKFGITYSKNMGSNLGDFIDLVMIEAAALKKVPEFSSFSFNARAQKFIEESNVVPLIRWLKHNSLSHPQIGRIICMSKGDVQLIRRHVEWLKSIHVNGRYIGVVFTRVGETILRRSIEEMDEIVVYLKNKGVRREWMGYVISRCPELVAFSMEEVKIRVRFYTDMGMNNHDFGTMVYDFPKALGYFALEEMKQKVNYLKEFGLCDNDVGRLLAFKPQLMACSIEERWKPLLKFLYYLGVDRDGMRRMLVIKPMVFCFDMEATIVPKVRFLQDLGITDDAIGRMLVKFPPLLTYSLYKKIRPVVVFLLTRAGVTQKNIAKVVALAPELLGCSIAHKLDGNVKYYLSLGISLRLLGEMIADFPMLLRYNVELLRPKYRYLRRTMIRPVKDLIEFPRFFSYSLEDRIIPRHKVMLENQVNFKLRYMLASSDEEFKQRVKAAVEKRQRFESGASSLHEEAADSETEDYSSVSVLDSSSFRSNDSNVVLFDSG